MGPGVIYGFAPVVSNRACQPGLQKDDECSQKYFKTIPCKRVLLY